MLSPSSGESLLLEDEILSLVDRKVRGLVWLVGGPGSGNSPHFSGDIAELRVYDRLLTGAERDRVEAELHHTWFEASDPNKPARNANQSKDGSRIARGGAPNLHQTVSGSPAFSTRTRK